MTAWRTHWLISTQAAARARGDVFVCGAANCGKSSFVNRAVGAYSGGQNYKGVKAWGVTACVAINQ